MGNEEEINLSNSEGLNFENFIHNFWPLEHITYYGGGPDSSINK